MILAVVIGYISEISNKLSFFSDAGANFMARTSFGKTAADMSEATDNKQIAKLIGEKKKLLHEENLRKMNEGGDHDISIDIGAAI